MKLPKRYQANKGFWGLSIVRTPTGWYYHVGPWIWTTDVRHAQGHDHDHEGHGHAR